MNFFGKFFGKKNEDSKKNEVNSITKQEKNDGITSEQEILKMILNKVYNQAGGLYDFDIEDRENWDAVADKILDAFARRHFSEGSDGQVVALLQKFLTNRTISRGLFLPHKKLAFVASNLMICDNNSEIREWAVDLFGRTCDLNETTKLIDLLRNENHLKVQQEIIAAFSKILMHRGPNKEIISQIKNQYTQFKNRLSNTGGTEMEGLINAMNILESKLD